MGLDGSDFNRAGVGEERVGRVEARELLEVLDRREYEQELPPPGGVECRRRRVPARIDHFAAVDARLSSARKRREIEPSVESGPHLRWGDPPREGDKFSWVVDADSGLLGELADRRRPQRAL